MKKCTLTYLSGLLIVCLFVVNACTQSDFDNAKIDAAAQKLAEDKALLTSLGYDTSNLIQLDTCYILEGDIWITDSWLTSMRNHPETRLTYFKKGDPYASTGYLVSPTNRTLKVYMNEEPLEDVFDSALSYWNNTIHCGIIFEKTASETDADIAIEYVNSSITPLNSHGDGGVTEQGMYDLDGQRSTVALVMPPSDTGDPGKYIMIDLNDFYSVPYMVQASQGKWFLVHMLGHAIGFGHTPTSSKDLINNYNQSYIDTGTSIPPFDSQSIMRYTPFEWEGASAIDIAAMNYVYPRPAAKLSVTRTPTGSYQINTQYTFTASYTDDPACTEPTFSFDITTLSGAPAQYTIKDNVCQASFPGGKYHFSVSVNNAPNPPDGYSEIIEISTAHTLTISPDEPIEIGKTYNISASYSAEDVANNLQYSLTATNKTFSGYDAKITPVDNHSWNVIFNYPGEYDVIGQSNSTVSVSKEVAVEGIQLNMDGNPYSSSLMSHVVHSNTVHHFDVVYFSEQETPSSFIFAPQRLAGPGTAIMSNQSAFSVDIYFQNNAQYSLKVIGQSLSSYQSKDFIINVRPEGSDAMTITPNDQPLVSNKTYLIQYGLNMATIGYSLVIGQTYSGEAISPLPVDGTVIKQVGYGSWEVTFPKPGEYILYFGIAGSPSFIIAYTPSMLVV